MRHQIRYQKLLEDISIYIYHFGHGSILTRTQPNIAHIFIATSRGGLIHHFTFDTTSTLYPEEEGVGSNATSRGGLIHHFTFDTTSTLYPEEEGVGSNLYFKHNKKIIGMNGLFLGKNSVHLKALKPHQRVTTTTTTPTGATHQRVSKAQFALSHQTI